MKNCLLIDCYDSFTHMLGQSLEQAGNVSLDIRPWDELKPEDFTIADCVVLSPGPGLPHEYPHLFRYLALLHHKPVLGICLGHQIMAMVAGARLSHLPQVMHGQQQQLILKKDDSLFKGLQDDKNKALQVGLYHSWHITNLPYQLELLAENQDGIVMAFRHRVYPWHSMQFHPESYMTTQGRKMLANWLSSFD